MKTHLTYALVAVMLRVCFQENAILIRGFQHAAVPGSVLVLDPTFPYTIALYPNPVRNTLFLAIDGTAQRFTAEMHTVYGNLLFMEKDIVQSGQFDISRLDTGAYLFLLKDEKMRSVGVWRVLKL